MATLAFEDWGRIAYRTAWERQKALVEKRVRGEIPDTIIFCEHDPVITVGRGAQRDNTAAVVKTKPTRAGEILPEILPIERGGLATYHGPGQIVAYPVFKLATKSTLPGRRGVVDLIRNLEEWTIDYLRGEGIDAGVVLGKTGVWVGSKRKIASIGIAARHWVSYHGIALNFATGSAPWKLINPCGMDSAVMTDMKKEKGKLYDYAGVRDALQALAWERFRGFEEERNVQEAPPVEGEEPVRVKAAVTIKPYRLPSVEKST